LNFVKKKRGFYRYLCFVKLVRKRLKRFLKRYKLLFLLSLSFITSSRLGVKSFGIVFLSPRRLEFKAVFHYYHQYTGIQEFA